MVSSPNCPRCGAHVLPSEANHEFRCLENHLTTLYMMGVAKGVDGEDLAGVNEHAAAMIQRVMALAWDWRSAAARDRRALPAEPIGPEDLDTTIARFQSWYEIGWLGGRLVSGEAMWKNPHVLRRKYSERLEDAKAVQEHPLMTAFELIRIHRASTNQWEWHMAIRTPKGSYDSLVVAPTAALAICRAAVLVSRRGKDDQSKVG